METFKLVIAIVFVSSTAFAEQPEVKPKVAPLERTLIVPDIIGLQFGSLYAAPSIGVSGLVSYTFSESNARGDASRYEAFGINPSFDVRVGRFTIGGALRIGHANQRLESSGLMVVARASSIAVVPRIGMLFPIAQHVTFWPRVGFGPTASSSEMEGFITSQNSTSAGVIGSLDALVVLDLGSRFFIHAGPNANVMYTVGDLPGDRSAQFRIGANVGMGVSF